jgi:hypothetical protein
MCREISGRGFHQLLYLANSFVLSSETKTCVYGLMNLTGHVLRVFVTLLIDKK